MSSCGGLFKASVNAHKGLEQSRRDDMEVPKAESTATAEAVNSSCQMDRGRGTSGTYCPSTVGLSAASHLREELVRDPRPNVRRWATSYSTSAVVFCHGRACRPNMPSLADSQHQFCYFESFELHQTHCCTNHSWNLNYWNWWDYGWASRQRPRKRSTRTSEHKMVC